MQYSFQLSQGFEYYFGLVFIFLCGYWIAFVYKNLSALLDRLGIIMFVVLMCFFFSTQAVMLPNIEGWADYYYSSAYGIGFFMRFFRHDY